MKMKQREDGLWVPDDGSPLKESINDFDVISPEELNQFMILPINAALAKGIPADQPTAIPVEAVARMCKTIMTMGNTLAMMEQKVQSILNSDDVSEETKEEIRKAFAPKVEKSSLFEDVENEIRSSKE